MKTKFYLISYFFAMFCFNMHSENFVNKEWVIASGSPLDSSFQVSQVNLNGELFLASNVSTLSEGTNVIISNFKEDGSEGWTLNYNGSSNLNDYPISMILDEDGFLYIAGITQQFLGNYDIFLLKIDFSGTLIWEYTYGSTYEFDDFVTGLKLDSKKNIYLCGTTSITSANFVS